MEDLILKLISKEIEEKYNCKVISIRIVRILSLCVDFKVQFNDDFLYKPFEDLPKPEMICFSDKTASFYKRVDLFDSVKNYSKNN
jgi:hypothetical protein